MPNSSCASLLLESLRPNKSDASRLRFGAAVGAALRNGETYELIDFQNNCIAKT
jgi:hypothetical protein